MALWANSTESFFLFGANEEDAISDFYGILGIKRCDRLCIHKTERSLPWI